MGPDPPAQDPGRDPLRGRPVQDIMKHRFITVSPEASLFEADRMMRLAGIRHLPVVQEGLLLGVLSHRDILEASVARFDKRLPQERAGQLRSIPVSRMMSRSPETVRPACPLAAAARRMYELQIGCLPVVEHTAHGDRLLGIVTESDLLRVAYEPELDSTLSD